MILCFAGCDMFIILSDLSDMKGLLSLFFLSLLACAACFFSVFLLHRSCISLALAVHCSYL